MCICENTHAFIKNQCQFILTISHTNDHSVMLFATTKYSQGQFHYNFINSQLLPCTNTKEYETININPLLNQSCISKHFLLPIQNPPHHILQLTFLDWAYFNFLFFYLYSLLLLDLIGFALNPFINSPPVILFVPQFTHVFNKSRFLWLIPRSNHLRLRCGICKEFSYLAILRNFYFFCCW